MESNGSSICSFLKIDLPERTLEHRSLFGTSFIQTTPGVSLVTLLAIMPFSPNCAKSTHFAGIITRYTNVSDVFVTYRLEVTSQVSIIGTWVRIALIITLTGLPETLNHQKTRLLILKDAHMNRFQCRGNAD